MDLNKPENLPDDEFQDLDEFLVEYVDGTIDPVVSKALEEYMAANPRLVSHVENLKYTRDILKKFSAQERELEKALSKKFRSFFDIRDNTEIDLAKPPGSNLMQLVRFFYSAQSVEKVFEPLYADFWEEYIEAYTSGYKRKAKWICCRYLWAAFKTAGLFSIVSIGKQLFSFWKEIA